MTLLALVSLAFSGWMAFTLYSSLKEHSPAGWRDYLSTAWIAIGSAAAAATAIASVLQ